MAASFTTGNTFSDGETLTATKLNDMVNAATVADIDRAEQSAGTRLIRIDAHAGNDRIGEVSWYGNWFSIQPVGGKDVVCPILLTDTTYTQSGNTLTACLFSSVLIPTQSCQITQLDATYPPYIDINDSAASPTDPRFFWFQSDDFNFFFAGLYGVLKVARANLSGDATIGDFAYASSGLLDPDADGSLDPPPIGVFMNSITAGQTGYIALWPGGF